MTARSIRRAQERKARKLARKGEAPLAQIPVSPSPISDAQLLANRQNAQLSTGPKSEEGKTKTSLNAVKTGLTGRTVLLPTDDAAEYQHHIGAYEKEFHPVGQRECDLVQSIADTQWRLLRIPSLESGIYALGHLEFKDAFEEHDPSLRPGMIEVRTFLTYQRQLRNLHLQESRLQRRREKEIAELRALQEDRKAEEAGRGEAPFAQMSQPTAPEPENGFVFSTGKVSQSLSPALPAASIAAPGIRPQTRAA